MSLMFASLGGTAIFLSVAGLYAVMAFSAESFVSCSVAACCRWVREFAWGPTRHALKADPLRALQHEQAGLNFRDSIVPQRNRGIDRGGPSGGKVGSGQCDCQQQARKDDEHGRVGRFNFEQ